MEANFPPGRNCRSGIRDDGLVEQSETASGMGVASTPFLLSGVDSQRMVIVVFPLVLWFYLQTIAQG
jgi:hypothetical protein